MVIATLVESYAESLRTGIGGSGSPALTRSYANFCSSLNGMRMTPTCAPPCAICMRGSQKRP
jgi:hypothetical protein